MPIMSEEMWKEEQKRQIKEERDRLQEMAARLRGNGLGKFARIVERSLELWPSEEPDSVPSTAKSSETERIQLQVDLGSKPAWKNELESLLVAILRNSEDMTLSISYADLTMHGDEKIVVYDNPDLQGFTIKLEKM